MANNPSPPPFGPDTDQTSGFHNVTFIGEDGKVVSWALSDSQVEVVDPLPLEMQGKVITMEDGVAIDLSKPDHGYKFATERDELGPNNYEPDPMPEYAVGGPEIVADWMKTPGSGTFTMGEGANRKTYGTEGGNWYEVVNGEKKKNLQWRDSVGHVATIANPSGHPDGVPDEPRPARKRSTLLTEVFGTGNHPLNR